MNERQKKIMVPYQEPMDTCPDCSEHPCDCGMPAGYQSDIRFACNFAPHIKVIEASKVAEIIEQRDRLAEALYRLMPFVSPIIGNNAYTHATEALQSLNQPKKYDANEHQSFYP
jgi:hypothetical protein